MQQEEHLHYQKRSVFNYVMQLIIEKRTEESRTVISKMGQDVMTLFFSAIIIKNFLQENNAVVLCFVTLVILSRYWLSHAIYVKHYIIAGLIPLLLTGITSIFILAEQTSIDNWASSYLTLVIVLTMYNVLCTAYALWHNASLKTGDTIWYLLDTERRQRQQANLIRTTSR